MATVTKRIVISSDDVFSDVLSIDTTLASTIAKDATLERTKMAASAADTTIYLAASYTRAYIYMKNIDGGATGNAACLIDFGTQLSMHLEKDDFAIFPWDSSGNIVAASETSGQLPLLEHAIFEF